METLTHPDGFAVDYNYDVLGRPTSVIEGTNTLATVAYDDHGRRASLSYGNGTSVDYDYDGGSRLDELDWDLAGSGNDFSYDMGFTPASQLSSLTLSDASMAWAPDTAQVDDYVANGLNQYTEIEGQSVSYDANGNIATDHRGRNYTYDAENRLRSVKDGSTTQGAYTYSSEGAIRLARIGADQLRYFHDGGGQELAEYHGSTYDLQRRYIRLPGSVDEVVLMIDYTLDDCSSSYAACEVWAHADRLGSTVRTSDSVGNEIDTYTYSKFGESGPEGDSGFPFRFTGQKLDPVTGLYNYKNRWYDPETGRFLQTDPIGYGDGMNMYAYTGNDPVNGRDPLGLFKRGDTAILLTSYCFSRSCSNESSGGGGGGGSGGGWEPYREGVDYDWTSYTDQSTVGRIGGWFSGSFASFPSSLFSGNRASGAFRSASGRGPRSGRVDGNQNRRKDRAGCNQGVLNAGNLIRYSGEVITYFGSVIAAGGSLSWLATSATPVPHDDAASGLGVAAGFVLAGVGTGVGILGSAIQGIGQDGLRGGVRAVAPDLANIGLFRTISKFGRLGKAIAAGEGALAAARDVISPLQLDPNRHFENCRGATLAGN